MSLNYHKLGDILTIERGGSPRPIQKYLTDDIDGLNWIKISDATASDKYIYETKQKISKDGLYKTRFVNEGDFILSNSMSFGKPYIMKTTGCIHDGWLVLRDIEKANLEKDFLYYILCSPNIFEQFNSLASGSTVRNLNIRLVSSVKIPIPPIEEQKQIVAILDKAFEAIDKAKVNLEKNIHNSKELFQSRLNEIFSQQGEDWEEKTLGEIGKVSMCKRILKKQTNSENGIPFYKIGTFGKEANAFISEEIYNEFKKKYSFPKKGDILLSASGTIGRRVIYDGKPAYFQDSNIVWIDNNEELILNEFLYEFYGFCQWNPSRGATISRLYNDDLRRIKINFPIKESQKSIVEGINKLKEQTKQLEKQYKQKLKNLEELKKSILQKAFSGELV
ncbi:restriction endonuclease subunit S [Halarcobacter sp.]|uniref:restriction endonuclease subunit S n=1 Tax=Halarcobacter sp. TaxID=2321133 RepID=UPI002AA6C028|nr:restriction endonuclease subunit S [Halarcobacter sp.]